MSIIHRRIEILKQNVKLTQVMDHFGHRYRLNGNMLCPFHEERNPSARLYAEQDTFWCWVCSPDHGVDIVEYVIMELSLDIEVDLRGELDSARRRSRAILRAIEYLENEFGFAYQASDWENRLQRALTVGLALPPVDDAGYWRQSHIQVLKLLRRLPCTPMKYQVYSYHMMGLGKLAAAPIADQRPFWGALRLELAELETT